MKLVKDTPFEVAWVAWQIRPPKPSLTLVVKGTFQLVATGQCPLCPTQLRPTGDQLFEDDEGESLRAESDLAPLKLHGECFLLGTFRPPTGPAPGSAVMSFRIGTVSKQLALFGDRHFTALGAVTKPAPIQAIPLRWERCFGGPAWKHNPLGRGIAPLPGEDRVALPNVEHPQAPMVSRGDRPPPAATGPLPRAFPARAGLTGTYDRAWREERWPYFPADFDYDHFNAAPEDQRIEGYFYGDEAISLQGALPDLPRVECRLPALRARGFLQTKGAAASELREVTLNLDTITVDLDARVVTALWRGVAELEREPLSEVERVFVLHEPLAGPPADPAAALQRRLAEESEAALPAPVTAAPAPPLPPADPALRAKVTAALAAGGSCAGFALGGADLAGLDLRKADLSKAVLTGANLRGAQLDGAKLDGAVLQGAHLAQAKLTGVSLVGADLTGCWAPAIALEGAKLDDALAVDAHLPAAQLGQCSLRGTDLSGANLEGAAFNACDMTKVDLSRAKLDDAVFTDCKLPDAWMEGGVSAKRVSLEGCDLARLRASDGGDFSEASLKNVKAAGARFVGAKLIKADLSFAVLEDAHFTGSDLTEAALPGCRLRHARFDGAKLTGATLTRADLCEANFEGADLRRAQLDGASLFRAELWQADLAGASLDGADLTGTKLG